jgi:hypothetical protein
MRRHRLAVLVEQTADFVPGIDLADSSIVNEIEIDGYPTSLA